MLCSEFTIGLRFAIQSSLYNICIYLPQGDVLAQHTALQSVIDCQGGIVLDTQHHKIIVFYKLQVPVY